MFMWLKLLSFSGGQEDLGSLVTMMFHVVLNLFTFIVVLGALILTFCIPLYVLLYDDVDGGFHEGGLSMLTSYIVMLGEVQPNFGMDGRTDAVIVFVLLTFVVSVIMFNTLIR